MEKLNINNDNNNKSTSSAAAPSTAAAAAAAAARSSSHHDDDEKEEKGWKRPIKPLHGHFDCFSGAAGDMMLAACLDAAGDGDDDISNQLVDHISECITKGIPQLAGEFKISYRQVWRGNGFIGAKHVNVKSIYNHQPAPVPSSSHSHSHGHDHQHQHHEHSHDSHHEHINLEDPTVTASDTTPAPVPPPSPSHSHDSHHEHINLEDPTVTASDTTPVSVSPPSPSHEHSHDSHHEHNNLEDPTVTAIDATTKIESKEENKISPSYSHHYHHHHHHHGGGGDRGGPLRNLPEIREMLLATPAQKWIPYWVRKTAIQCFTELAIAEATVHGAESADKVHFHEVGAVDSIVDMVGTLLALYSLGIETVSCSRLPLGEGYVKTDHGVLPVPAPATLHLMVGMPTTRGPPGYTGELVTPTGAALLRVLTKAGSSSEGSNSKSTAGKPPPFTIVKVGIGAGTKNFKQHPNIIRLMIGDLS